MIITNNFTNGNINGSILKSKNYYVYSHHRKSDNSIFYIGIGRFNRCNQKMQRSEWWKRVFTKHGRYVNILHYDLTKEEAKSLEIYLIKHHRSIGSNIVNMTEGGDICSNIYKKKVHQYTIQGDYIQTFESLTEASFCISGKRLGDKIALVCEGKRRLFYNFRWSYNKVEKLNKPLQGVNVNKKPVYQYDLNGNFIKKWDKVQDVHVLGSRTNVSNVLDKNKTAFGSFWRSKFSKSIEVVEVKPALRESIKVLNKVTGELHPSVSKAAKSIGYTRKKLTKRLTGEIKNDTDLVLWQ